MVVQNQQGFARVNGQLISQMLNEVTASFEVGRSRYHSDEPELILLTTIHPATDAPHNGP